MDHFKEIINQIKKSKSKSFLIRGVNESLLKFLSEKNFDKIIFGREAVLEFSKDHFKKKSLKELVKRGFKKGRAVEANSSKETLNKLLDLRHKSTHGNEPQLDHLFITRFLDETRLFVFIDKNEEWLGGILVSENSPDKYHTELLLRNINAPIGVMEALIYYTLETLKESSKKEFSLGEVPFVVDIPITTSFYRDYILNKIAKVFRFAYNYKGLFDFKNKFNPRWDDVYICGYPKLRLSHIVGIIIRSNLLRLILYKLINKKRRAK